MHIDNFATLLKLTLADGNLQAFTVLWALILPTARLRITLLFALEMKAEILRLVENHLFRDVYKAKSPFKSCLPNTANNANLTTAMRHRLIRMSLPEFQSTFAGKAPCTSTFKRLIDSGDLPGEKIGSRYYVHVDPQGQLYRQNLKKNGDNDDPNGPLFQKLTEGY